MVKTGSKMHSGFVFVFAFVDFSILCLESGACHETLLSYALSSDFCRQTSRNAGSFQAIFAQPSFETRNICHCFAKELTIYSLLLIDKQRTTDTVNQVLDYFFDGNATKTRRLI